MSNSKILKYGTVFLYQVFPLDLMFYNNLLIRACNDKDINAAKRLVGFFSRFKPEFINLKESLTHNTALHVAAANGFFDIVHFLLDHYAQVNSQNLDGNTPLFLASDSFHRDCAKVIKHCLFIGLFNQIKCI